MQTAEAPGTGRGPIICSAGALLGLLLWLAALLALRVAVILVAPLSESTPLVELAAL